jgi:hypothetical protein
MMKVMT